MSTPFKIDELKQLHEKQYRDERRLFLAEGEHLVLELAKALRHKPELSGAQVFVSHEFGNGEPLADWSRAFPVHRINSRQISALSDTRNPQGIVAVVPMLSPAPVRLGEKSIYLHEIQDPGNLGTILRTLAWFGDFRCLLSPQSVDPYNPKVIRASMGAIFSVPIETDVSIEELITRCPRLALLDVHGESLTTTSFSHFDGYVFGSEARGLPAALTSRSQSSKFSIPGSGRIDSLNLASAVNICSYELRRGVQKSNAI